MSFRGHYGIPVHKQEFQVLSHEVFFFLNPFLREQKESSSAALASPSLSFPLRQERRVFAAATRGLHSCCCRGRRKGGDFCKLYYPRRRPLQIAYKTALSESLLLSTIHIAYTSAPFTQSTLHTIHIAYRCITINIAYRPKISHFQGRDR